MGAGTGSQQSLPQEARTEAKVRAWEAVESSGWGMSVAFIGPVVVDMDLGMSSACVWCIPSR